MVNTYSRIPHTDLTSRDEVQWLLWCSNPRYVRPTAGSLGNTVSSLATIICSQTGGIGGYTARRVWLHVWMKSGSLATQRCDHIDVKSPLGKVS